MEENMINYDASDRIADDVGMSTEDITAIAQGIGQTNDDPRCL